MIGIDFGLVIPDQGATLAGGAVRRRRPALRRPAPCHPAAARTPEGLRRALAEVILAALGLPAPLRLDPPPAAIVAKVATAAKVEAANVAFVYAPTQSLAGTVQIVARSLERRGVPEMLT